MSTTTARRGFTNPALTDTADITLAVGTHLAQLDAQLGSITQGTLAARPGVGKDGDIYIARDDLTFGPNGSPAWWDSANNVWRSLKHVASHGIGGADALVGTGTYAARPAANAVPAGFVYKATNAGTYVSDGANWSMLAPGFFSLAIAATETRTNVAYGLMTTPDRVAGLAMPPNGMFKVGYQAMWQESSANAARAALFMGANQVQIGRIGGNAGPATQAGQHGSGAIDLPLTSFGGGLISGQGIGQGADVATGQIVGFVEAGSGLPGAQQEIGGSSYSLPTSAGQFFYPGTGGSCDIFAAAGVYDVSVQFKASGVAVVTAKNRKLWVEVWGV